MIRPKKPGSQAARLRVYKSKKDELRIAEELGGKRLPASGAKVSELDGKSAKGDLSIQGFWVEQKSTDEAQLSLKVAWLQKVWEGARMVAKQPAVTVTLRKARKDYILIPQGAAIALGLGEPTEIKRVVAGSVILSATSLVDSADTGVAIHFRCFRFMHLEASSLSLALVPPPAPPSVWVLMSLQAFKEARKLE